MRSSWITLRSCTIWARLVDRLYVKVAWLVGGEIPAPWRLLGKQASQRNHLMRRYLCLVAALFFIASHAPARGQEKTPEAAKKLPDGVYAVLRDSLKEKEVMPLKEGEALAVHRHRYLKKGADEPPRFLVVRPAPDVVLDLAGAPKAVKDDADNVRIQLKLRPKAATALERLTRDRLGRQVAIILSGEVVTMHKIREVIKGGDLEITSCAAGAAEYLLKQLQGLEKKK